MNITRGDTAAAADIMREAAAWLRETGRPLWRPEDLTEERILAGVAKEDVCVGRADGEAAAAMILQWSDPVYWPEAGGDSGFIHKLSVRRRFAGKGLARDMVEWAAREAQRRGKKYLRLDCAADRVKLRAFYESLGFRLVGLRDLGAYRGAFYERELTLREA